MAFSDYIQDGGEGSINSDDSKYLDPPTEHKKIKPS